MVVMTCRKCSAPVMLDRQVIADWRARGLMGTPPKLIRCINGHSERLDMPETLPASTLHRCPYCTQAISRGAQMCRVHSGQWSRRHGKYTARESFSAKLAGEASK